MLYHTVHEMVFPNSIHPGRFCSENLVRRFEFCNVDMLITRLVFQVEATLVITGGYNHLIVFYCIK